MAGRRNDALIGGAGEDTYVINGHDRIIDTGRNFIVWNGQTIAGEFKAEEGNPGMYRFVSDDNEWSLVFHSPGVLTLSPEDSVTFVNQTSAAAFADHDFGITLQEQDPEEFDITINGTAYRDEMGIFDIGTDQRYWQLECTSFPDLEPSDAIFRGIPSRSCAAHEDHRR